MALPQPAAGGVGRLTALRFSRGPVSRPERRRAGRAPCSCCAASVLNLLVEQLAIYADNSANAEDFKECVEFLVNKADTFLNISPEELLKAL